MLLNYKNEITTSLSGGCQRFRVIAHIWKLKRIGRNGEQKYYSEAVSKSSLIFAGLWTEPRLRCKNKTFMTSYTSAP